MPRKLELTWDKHSKRWKKFYHGRQYYFRTGESKTDAEGYLKALDAWKRKKAELDGTVNEAPGIRTWGRLIARAFLEMKQCEQADTEANRLRWQMLNSQVAMYRKMIELGIPWDEEEPNKLPLVGNAVDDSPPPWQTPIGTASEGDDDKSIGGFVERFLWRKRKQTEKGERSHGHYGVLSVCLQDFAKWIGSGNGLDAITGPVLLKYKDRLEKRVDDATKAKGRKFSPFYAKRHLEAVRQFVRWCWEQDAMELPRILRGREFTFALPQKQIEVFTVEELQTILGASPEILKLYLLLMLNCGMTQQDIANLKQTEVDLDQGRITRKRSKTAKHENVPEVSYILWKESRDLLRKYRSNHPDLALTNRKGKPLKTEDFDEKGRVTKSDNIRSSFARVLRKLATADKPVRIGKPLKLFRKTAASKLGEHAEFGRYAQYFLGHSPKTIADRHYVKPSDEAFDRAIRWLGEQFGF